MQHKKILIAASGGPDSMALLHWCLKRHYKISGVVHVNYNFRKSSIRDKKIVRKFCHKHHIKLYVKNINKDIYKSKKIKNFENWARTIRYDFFSFISSITNTNLILMAHHKDDFIETGIRQILKKQERFFFGIKTYSNYKKLKIVRPFLKKYWKSQILYYCNKNKIPYGIDETNYNVTYERNWIRSVLSNYVIQKQEIYGRLNFINNYLKRRYHRNISQFFEWRNNKFHLSFLNKISYSDQKSLIKIYLFNHEIKNISRKKIDGILKFLNSSLNQKKLRIGNNIYIKKDKKYLKLS